MLTNVDALNRGFMFYGKPYKYQEYIDIRLDDIPFTYRIEIAPMGDDHKMHKWERTEDQTTREDDDEVDCKYDGSLACRSESMLIEYPIEAENYLVFFSITDRSEDFKKYIHGIDFGFVTVKKAFTNIQILLDYFCFLVAMGSYYKFKKAIKEFDVRNKLSFE